MSMSPLPPLQDFFNVDASDPMCHTAKFFYGSMLQVPQNLGSSK